MAQAGVGNTAVEDQEVFVEDQAVTVGLAGAVGSQATCGVTVLMLQKTEELGGTWSSGRACGQVIIC
jgi:hypothetical protein